jgi:hypothetical protein
MENEVGYAKKLQRDLRADARLCTMTSPSSAYPEARVRRANQLKEDVKPKRAGFRSSSPFTATQLPDPDSCALLRFKCRDGYHT